MTDTTKSKDMGTALAMIAGVLAIFGSGYGVAKMVEIQKAEESARAELTASVNTQYEALMRRKALEAAGSGKRDIKACADAMDRANAAARVNDSDASIQAQTDMLRTCGI